MINMRKPRNFALCCGILISLLWGASGLAEPRILVVGDSLTEGYGVAKTDSFPALLEKKLKQNGHPGAVVVNAGIAGATSAVGERTIRFHAKRQKPELIILALGANDALRGL